MRIHREHLRRKGWSEAEIMHAEAALGRADAAKHPALHWLERAVFWGLLFLTIVGIFLVSVLLVPLLLVLDTPIIALLLVLLGLCLGTLYAHLIKDVEWAEDRHHILNFAVIAVIGVANVWFIVSKVNAIEEALAIGIQHSPYFLGVAFAAGLLAPYAFHLAIERRALHG